MTNWFVLLGSMLRVKDPMSGTSWLLLDVRGQERPVLLFTPSFNPGRGVSVVLSKLCLIFHFVDPSEFIIWCSLKLPVSSRIALVLLAP